MEIIRGNLNRPSLTLQTIRLQSQAERLAWLAEQLPALPGHGIIYTLTVRDAEQVSEWLGSRGLNVRAYTGKTGEQRPELEDALLQNRVKALVATTALGMGFDKPDLAFVIHYQAPGSAIAYYQQVGRAGRALDTAYGVLLSGQEETEITDYFIKSAFPTRDEVQKILNALEEEPNGLSVPKIEGVVNISNSRIQKAMQLLSLEAPAPVAKQGSKWQLTAATLSPNFWERAERLTEVRKKEQEQMQEYVRLSSGHMEFLVRALDGEPDNIFPPRLPPLATEPNLALVQEAIDFLRRTNLPIEPRKKWPSGGLRHYKLSGQIVTHFQSQPGMALCNWDDAGWGSLVRQGKYHDGHLSDELVEACKTLVKKWNPQPVPKWVTCIPSRRHPGLVPDFARRLAKALDLPFKQVLIKTKDRPEQKTMANSTQQGRNIDGALALIDETLPDGALLLVDDMVDSRWTFTVAAWLLRSHGSGEVWPLALAQTGGNP